jgi:hypothetical protein
MITPPRKKNVDRAEAGHKTEASRIERLKDSIVETLGIAEEARALGVLLNWYADYAGDDFDARVVAAGAASVERTARKISDDLCGLTRALDQMIEPT